MLFLDFLKFRFITDSVFMLFEGVTIIVIYYSLCPKIWTPTLNSLHDVLISDKF